MAFGHSNSYQMALKPLSLSIECILIFFQYISQISRLKVNMRTGMKRTPKNAETMATWIYVNINNSGIFSIPKGHFW